MKFSDDMLMAYADGELDLVARAEIEAAMARDPAVARAVERHRAMAVKLRKAYESVLDEPLPPALAALAGDEEAAKVVDLAAARGRRVSVGRWQLPAWSAIAVSVLIGVLAGILLVRGGASPYEETPAGLVARGELADGLESGLASAPGSSNVAIGISFRHRDGRYCRSFTFRARHVGRRPCLPRARQLEDRVAGGCTRRRRRAAHGGVDAGGGAARRGRRHRRRSARCQGRGRGARRPLAKRIERG